MINKLKINKNIFVNTNYVWYIYRTKTNKNMKTLNLATQPTTKGTAKMIREFVYANRAALSNDLKAFYQTIACMIDREVMKPVSRRAAVGELTERSYNIDQYVLASGAASFEQEFISTNLH